jgi:hypothetical protein
VCTFVAVDQSLPTSEALSQEFLPAITRECHGFTNLCGLASQVVAGVDVGWVFVIPA